MSYSEVVYLSLVGQAVTEYPQTADQACQAVGANLVTGFKVFRREFKTQKDNKPCTVVPVYGHNGVLFGAYVFTGTM